MLIIQYYKQIIHQNIVFIIINSFQIQVKQMGIFKKIGKFILQFDYFAPPIRLRYQSDSDYKTITSALISIGLFIWFAVIFIQSFISMIQKNQIEFNMIQSNQANPISYEFSTNNIMFAIGINNINMNSLRYFNTNLSLVNLVNGYKNVTQIPLQACTVDQWQKFGKDIVDLYYRLNFSQWLCPKPDSNFILQGKYSSNIFNYIKIGLSNCTGIVNGNECQSFANIEKFFNSRQTISFNFYFINTLLNPGDKIPSTIYLDDTNNFQFSFKYGTSINYYFQQYHIKTDESILPLDNLKIQSGLIGTLGTQNQFQIGSNSYQYLKFYIRKSPTAWEVDRKFLKIDGLLSYIGGLFGLIYLLINLPLYYYNLICFELSLATELFDQKQKNKIFNQQIQKQNNINLHNVQNFNFFWYILYLPFHFFKSIGCNFSTENRLDPYYTAIKQVRKQIDISGIIKSFHYLKKMPYILLDQHQRKLLYLCPKQNIFQAQKQRTNFKLLKKLSKITPIKSTPSIISIQENNKTSTKLFNDVQQMNVMRQSYKILKKRVDDKISLKILGMLDREIVRNFEQDQDTYNSLKQMSSFKKLNLQNTILNTPNQLSLAQKHQDKKSISTTNNKFIQICHPVNQSINKQKFDILQNNRINKINNLYEQSFEPNTRNILQYSIEQQYPSN